MQTAGYDLDKMILVTDRGYQSIDNTAYELKLNLKFIQGITALEDCVKAAFERLDAQLKSLVIHYDLILGVNAFTEKENWAVDTFSGRISTKVALHLYRDNERAIRETRHFMNAVLKVADQLNEGKTVHRDEMKLYGKFVVKHHDKHIPDIMALDKTLKLPSEATVDWTLLKCCVSTGNETSLSKISIS